MGPKWFEKKRRPVQPDARPSGDRVSGRASCPQGIGTMLPLQGDGDASVFSEETERVAEKTASVEWRSR